MGCVYRVLVGKPKERDHWGDQGADGRIIVLTLQRRGIYFQVHTMMPEGFSAGHLNFELNCAGVYINQCSFINTGWISMKLET